MEAAERRAWGPVVRLARESRGLTQQEVCDLADVSRPTLRGMEKGSTAPQEDKLLAVLHALGLVDDLQNPDVTVFLSRIRPVLAELDKPTRDQLMPVLVDMVGNTLGASNVRQIRPAKRERSIPKVQDSAAYKGKDRKPTMGDD